MSKPALGRGLAPAMPRSLRQWIKLLATLLIIAGVRAEVVIDFRNEVLGGNARVVNYDFWAPGGLGQPVVSSPTKTFLAQLHWTQPGNETGWQPVGDPSPFRESLPTDPLAGTWHGADRVIPGLPPDAEVWLKVEVYSYSPAKGPSTRCGFSGWSSVFSYRDALSSPPHATNTFMVNFQGFPVHGPLCPVFFPQPQQLPCSENDEVLIQVPPRRDEAEWQGIIEDALNSPPVPSQFHGEVLRRADGFHYRPTPHTYGTEYLQSVSCCDPCLECSTVTVCIFTVLPSARRPYLAVKDGSRQLVLRGLAERRYLLERSRDLAEWDSAGEFTANYSEVTVLDLAADTTAARFFRVVELPR